MILKNKGMQEFKNRHLYKILLLVLILVFVIIKIPYLSLPYFWDESWSYGQAIHYMYKNGLGILPGSLPHSLSKGHPLLFFCIAAFGMKIFGTGLIGSHILPLIISIGLIVMVFYFARIFFNEAVGFMSAVFMSCQALFISQANLLLPEVFIGLCTLMALYGYLRYNLFLFYLGSIAFLLTKETGFCLILFVLAWEMISLLKGERNFKQSLRRMFLFALPLIPALAFYLLQKKTHGFYLYPIHVDMMQYEPLFILDEMKDYFHEVFFSNEKFFAFFIAAIGLIFIIRRKDAELKKKLYPCLVLISFTLFYIFFMSFQFINMRYSLTVIPLVSICISALIYYSLDLYPKFRLVLFSSLIAIISSFTYFKGTRDRETLGYVDFIKCDKAAIHYLAEKNYYDKKFYAQYLMLTNMKFPEAGYLQGKEIFSNFADTEKENFDLFILTSYDYFPLSKAFIRQRNLKLEKEFSSGKEWTKIFKTE
jgi:4-amino-4-deoxy-L-arabinose transferase-like glycosyltransferase